MVLMASIPVSVIFEAFKQHRKKQVIEDRMRERKALLAAFHCLDTKQEVCYILIYYCC
jgi:hypothetical protein